MNKKIKNNIIIIAPIIISFIFLYIVRGILLPFILGAVIAYLMDGITTKLEKITKNRSLASLIIMIIFTFLVVSFFIFVIPILLTQTTDLIKELITHITKNNELILEKILKFMSFFKINDDADFKYYLSNYNKSITSYLIGILNKVLSSSVAFINVLYLIIMTPITSYYFLTELHNIKRTIIKLIPTKYSNTINVLFNEINKTLSGCLRGQLNVCCILAIFYSTLLMSSGLKYGFLIGLLTGLASFIPYFGMFVGFFVAILTALYQFGFETLHILMVLLIFGAGQIFEGNFITPKFVGKKIGLHPLWIIFALFAGGSMFGFIGLLSALPIAGVLGVLIKFYIKTSLKYIKNEQ